MTSDNLILQLLELHPGGLASGSGLEPGQDRTDSVLTDLLHLTWEGNVGCWNYF